MAFLWLDDDHLHRTNLKACDVGSWIFGVAFAVAVVALVWRLSW